MALWLNSQLAFARIAYGYQFLFWMLCIHSHSCMWPGRAMQDGPKPWIPEPGWVTKKGSWVLISDRLSSAHYNQLWGKPAALIIFLLVSPSLLNLISF